jgi:hypothetical protein
MSTLADLPAFKAIPHPTARTTKIDMSLIWGMTTYT